MGDSTCYEGKNCNLECNKKPCETCDSYRYERRADERRARGVSLKLSERREGFDRRENDARRKGLYYLIFHRGARHLRNSEYALIVLLIIFNLFNIADYLFTVRALSAGFLEGNPIMDAMFKISPLAAFGLKMAVSILITAMVWYFKRYRAVLQVSIFFIILYTVLIGYHIYGAVVYSSLYT